MSIIAASGVVITAAAMFIVLSGFAGLKDFSLQFSSLIDPDLKIIPIEGKSFIISEKQKKQLSAIQGIQSYSNIIEERIVIEFDQKKELATLKGVDENYYKVAQIDSIVALGNWFDNSNQVVAGFGISNKLSFGIFDYTKTLTIYVPKPGQGQLSSVKSAFNSVRVTNVGIFDVNEDLNSEYIFAHINTAKRLLHYKNNQVSAIEIKLTDTADETIIRKVFLELFNNKVVIKNKTQLNDALYKMLNTENVVVYLIFTLIIIIGLFNIIGTLIMMILDKKQSLNTLYNLGTTTKNIKKIFLLQGSLMAIIAGFSGVTLGFILVVIQKQFSVFMLTPSLPYPVSIQLINIIISLGTISVLGVLASKIASGRITKRLIKA